jgi:hypothetical protein
MNSIARAAKAFTVYLADVDEHAAETDLLESELPLHNAERMLTFCRNISLMQAEACS